jgi:PAS domain-containing protein
MQKNRIWFESILNSVGEGLIVVHPDGEIRFAHPVARSMLSLAPSPAEDTMSLNQLVTLPAVRSHLSDYYPEYRAADTIFPV